MTTTVTISPHPGLKHRVKVTTLEGTTSSSTSYINNEGDTPLSIYVYPGKMVIIEEVPLVEEE